MSHTRNFIFIHIATWNMFKIEKLWMKEIIKWRYLYLNITCISLVSWQESYISLIYSLLFVLLTFFYSSWHAYSRCCHHHAINHKTRFCCYANAYLSFSYFFFLVLSTVHHSWYLSLTAYMHVRVVMHSFVVLNVCYITIFNFVSDNNVRNVMINK